MNYTSLKFPTNKCYKCLTGEIDDGNSATILFYGLLFNLAIIIVNVIWLCIRIDNLKTL